MAQQLLDLDHVGAAFESGGGKGVAKSMDQGSWRYVGPDAGSDVEALDQVLNLAGGQAITLVVDE